jgi:nucleoside-diphosphate-sugar epimerase
MDIITGGAGMLGAELTFQLLRAGHQVCSIVRPTRLRPNVRRRQVESIVRLHPETPLGEDELQRLVVIQGDVQIPRFNLANGDLSFCRRSDVRFLWHCAADLRHDQRFETEILNSNVIGVKNAAEFAAAIGARCLQHISTAYVSPVRHGMAYEEPLLPKAEALARNLYERSKIWGERALNESARTPYNILRTTTLIGPATSGRAVNTAAYFGCIRGLFYIMDYACKSDSGMTVRFRELPFRIPGDGNVHLNLLPVDFAARELIESGANIATGHGDILHIADGSPGTLQEHVALIGDCLDWRTLVLTDQASATLSPMERAFAELMADYQVQYFRRDIGYSIKNHGRKPKAALQMEDMRLQIHAALEDLRADVRGLKLAHFMLNKRETQTEKCFMTT